MTKIKNRILIILALVMLCAVGVFALAACNNTETYTVTFMVRENGTTGDWQQYTTVNTNDDGSVTLPAEPTVDGYTFRDWYTDEACSADNVFDESNVTGDITVYALMAEANITLNITDGSGTATQIAGTLSALSQTTADRKPPQPKRTSRSTAGTRTPRSRRSIPTAWMQPRFTADIWRK
mgnify:CR=1 FL=1